ncbi:uncharacterized protein LOC142229446 [Haematobia irritans]|uniref:uncharacterized protein LOC142229446 n=1 Tax=Haematobia irritans TaxID=7368 RepID=UPI003F5031FD
MKIFFVAFCFMLLALNCPIAHSDHINGHLCEVGKNEVFLHLGPNCDHHCKTLNEPCLKKGEPHRTGCFCRKGFARNDHNECIPITFCDRQDNTL